MKSSDKGEVFALQPLALILSTLGVNTTDDYRTVVIIWYNYVCIITVIAIAGILKVNTTIRKYSYMYTSEPPPISTDV